jgi:hypothetical protein
MARFFCTSVTQIRPPMVRFHGLLRAFILLWKTLLQPNYCSAYNFFDTVQTFL